MPADRSSNLQTEEGPVNFEKMSPAEHDAWLCEGLDELLKSAQRRKSRGPRLKQPPEDNQLLQLTF